MKEIALWEGGKTPYAAAGDPFVPVLEPYLIGNGRDAGAVAVCPGGGYGGCAAHEGKPVAEFFNSRGMHAFVVQYRVSPNRHPAPLADICRAVRIIRDHAADWGVRPDKIAVCGFSAGGHLTASIGVHYDLVKPEADDLCGRISARPDALILGYPVISSKEFGHRGSMRNLLGENPSTELLAMASLEDHVSSSTPPSFLWHTADDPGVPVENSLCFCRALNRHRIPFELHVFPEGRHGLGLAPDFPHIAVWKELCADWLERMNWN